jgi:O-antigen/teichoic acid export membrane protein
MLVLPLLVFAHEPLAVVLGVWVGCYVMAACLTAFWTRNYALGAVDETVMREVGGKQFRFSLESCAVFFLSYLNLRIDLFIVGALRGPVELGWYALAVSAAELLWQWSKALNWSAFGGLAGEEQGKALDLLAKLTRSILIVQSALALAAYWAAPRLITAVYGEAFAASVPVLRMLLPGIIAYSLEAAFGYFIMVRLKRPLVNLVLQASSTVACALLTALLLPRYGLVGAAFATSLTYFTVTLLSILIVVKVTGLHPLRLIVPDLHFRETMRPLGRYVGRVNGVVSGVHGLEGIGSVMGGEGSGKDDAGV